jgi:large subunit ribosomal protein L7e
VPTKNDILVPETVLKKRKSQEKQRELKAVQLKNKREVSRNASSSLAFVMILLY